MKLINIPFNINGWVKVRLSEKAKKYLENERVKYGGKLILDEEGYLHSQLWCLIKELGSIMNMCWSPIEECKMIFECIEVPKEIIKSSEDKSIEELMKSMSEELMEPIYEEFRKYFETITKYKVNNEYFDFLGKVCTYYGYTVDDLKEKLIKKEDMRRFETVFEELVNKKR